MEQLRRYEEYEAAAKGSPERMLLRDLKGALSQEARANLEDMARVSVILGCMPSLDSLSLAEEDVTTTAERRIMELTQELFRLQNEVEELSSLKQSFDDERRGKEEKIWELREDAAAVEDDDLPGQAIETGSESSSARITLDTLLAQTTHFNTSTKQLTLKIKEYQDRINGLNRSLEVQRQRECDITIEDIQRREDVLQRERVEIEKLQTKLREYHGLPSDLDASREEVRRAQGELEEWRRRRESAFETIGGAR